MTTVRYSYERNYCGVCNISQDVFIATCQTKVHIIIMEVLMRRKVERAESLRWHI